MEEEKVVDDKENNERERDEGDLNADMLAVKHSLSQLGFRFFFLQLVSPMIITTSHERKRKKESNIYVSIIYIYHISIDTYQLC